MSVRSSVSRWTLALALAMIATTGAAAQSGSVSGSVHDSIAGRPLHDAAVFLWDTPFRGVTDANGRFTIVDVPPGDYTILFFHTRLGELGVSPGQRAVTVRGGEEATIDLATPSISTVIVSQCLMEDRPEGSGAVAGRILDGESELTLGDAQVTLSWHEAGSVTPQSINLRTGPDGWYRSCAVPSDLPVLVSADFIGRQGLRREIEVVENGFTEAGVTLESLQPTRVGGRIRDRDSNDGVEGAETWLRGTTFRTLTDGGGAFLFEGVPPGEYMLMTDHLAYGTKMDTLTVPSGQRLSVKMLLDTRPIEIAPITVTVEEAPVEMARRLGGIVVTREEIDQVRQRSRDASDVLRSLHVPGVLVRHNTNGTICVGYITGQVKLYQNGCVEMMIYLNDVRATDSDLALRLPPDAIERMVIFKPVEAGNLFGLGGGNGVWMIYTRGN